MAENSDPVYVLQTVTHATKTSRKAFNNRNYIFLVLPIVLGILIVTIGAITPAFGATAQVTIPQGSSTIPPNTSITVSTDRASYNSGDTITISGKSSSYISGTKVTIVIENPAGNVAMYTKVILRTDQTFSTTLTTADILWRGGETFTVYAQLETPKISATTTFNVNSNVNATPTISGNQSGIPLRGPYTASNQTVPEFGPLSGITIIISIIGALAISRKFRNYNYILAGS